MTNRRTPLLILAAALGATAGPASADDVIRDVRIVDVAAGTVGPPQDIIIRDDAIAAIVPTGGPLPKGAVTHEGAGGYAVPGLWDTHVHVFSSPEEPLTAFRLDLPSGVTGVRDMGGPLPLEEQHRIADGTGEGTILGPRVILSGAWIDAPPGSWPGMFLAATPAEGRARMRETAALGWAASSGRIRAALEAEDPRGAMIAEMAGFDRILLDTWEAGLCERVIAHDGGVPIVAGTDASFANPYIFHGFSLRDELDRHVEAGLDPCEALVTATVAPPRFLGRADQDGTLAPGRRADLLIIATDPLRGLAGLRRPVMVVAAGRVLDRLALDALERGLIAEGAR